MSEVKRFEMEKEYSLDINIVPTEYPDGSFVHYDDYAAIQEQLAQRDAQIAALDERLIRYAGIATARAEHVAEQEKQIAALTVENVALKCPELQELLRLVECMSGDYCDGNYGHSHEWIRHIVTQQNEYQDKFGDTPYGIASGSKYLVTDAAANALRAEGLEMLAEQCDGYALNHVYTYTKRHAKEFAQQLREGK